MATPTLDEFLGAARAENPGVSDGQLASYWLKTYGSGKPEAPKPESTAGGLLRSFGSSAIDTVGSAFQGGGEVVAAGARALTGSQDIRAANPLRPVTDAIRGGMSEGDKLATQDTFKGDILDPASIELPKTPGGWAHAIASGFGSLSSMILPGAMAATGMRGMIAAGAATGALTTGGAAADDVRQNVQKAMEGQTPEQLAQAVPAYRDARAQGLDDFTARQKVENDAAILATAVAGAAGAAGGAFNAKVLEDVVAKRGLATLLGKASASKAGQIGIGAGVGTVAEGFQEGLEKVGQNVGENIGMGRPAMENATRDTAGDVIMGGMIGAATGGAAGVVTQRPTPAVAEKAERAAAVQDIATAPDVDTAVAAFNRATKPSEPAVDFSADEAAAVNRHAQQRLAALERISQGAKGGQSVDVDGQMVKMPDQPGRFFTAEEKQEYDFLRSNQGNIKAIAQAYGFKPAGGLEFDRLGALGMINAPAAAAPEQVGPQHPLGDPNAIPYDYSTPAQRFAALPAPESPTGAGVLINDADPSLTRPEQYGDRETRINAMQRAREEEADAPGVRDIVQTPEGPRRRARITLDEAGNIIDAPDEHRPFLSLVRRDARPHAAAAIEAHSINPVLTEAVLAAPDMGPRAERTVFEAIINGNPADQQTRALLERYGVPGRLADGNGQGAQPGNPPAPGQQPGDQRQPAGGQGTGGTVAAQPDNDNRRAGIVTPPGQIPVANLQNTTPEKVEGKPITARTEKELRLMAKNTRDQGQLKAISDELARRKMQASAPDTEGKATAPVSTPRLYVQAPDGRRFEVGNLEEASRKWISSGTQAQRIAMMGDKAVPIVDESGKTVALMDSAGRVSKMTGVDTPAGSDTTLVAPEKDVTPAKAKTRAKLDAQKPATAQAAIDAFNADDAKTGMEIVAKLKLDALKEVGAAIGFSVNFTENATRYRERLAAVADRLTKSAREQTGRERKLFDRLSSLAYDWDRMVDHTGAPEGSYDGKWMTHPEARKYLIAELDKLKDDPDYNKVAPMVQKARPRLFDAAETPPPKTEEQPAENRGAQPEQPQETDQQYSRRIMREMADRKKEQDAEAAKAAEEAKYQPFNAADIKKPTPSSMGLTATTAAWFRARFEGRTVWTNGHIVDFAGGPKGAEKYTSARDYDEKSGGQPDIAKIMPKAPATVPGVPVAVYHNQGKEIEYVVGLKFGDKVVAVDRDYFAYFTTTYPGATFMVEPNYVEEGKGQGPMRVMRDGEMIGLAMPARMDDAFRAKVREMAGAVETAPEAPAESVSRETPEPEAVAKRRTPKREADAIQDAGQKIGGARKDKWKERGLNLDDLDAMSESEGAELATKANVWKPDYAQMVADGATPKVAAMLKGIYDSLAAQPKDNTPEGRRRYVTMMQAFRQAYSEAIANPGEKTPEQVLRAAMETMKQRIGVIDADNKRTNDEAAKKVLFSVYKGRSDPFVTDWMSVRKAEKLVREGFPEKGEPWKRRFFVRGQGGTGITPRGVELVMEEATKAGTPLTADQVKSGYYTVSGTTGGPKAYLPTKADAEAAAKTLYEQALKANATEDKTPDRPYLDELKREGLAQRTDRDVTADDFIKEFGFRGVEFGNWAAQDERQRILNMAFDGLHDLAEIMGVPPRAMSLNGTMGMAFGARGGGRFAAHYEPGKLVINMTKLRGSGSLAHEFAHALDHYFGELDRQDAYKTKARGASGWYEQEAYTGEPMERFEKVGGDWKKVSKMRLPNLRPELAKAFDNVMSALFQDQETKAQMVRGLELQLERTQTMAVNEQDPKLKAMYQRSVQSQRQNLEETRKEPDDKTYPKGQSQYAKEAQKLSGKSESGYWSRPTEMFARAFESWVFDRLTAMGARSDYLVHGVESDRYAGKGYKGNPYPTGEERARINAAFDRLAKTFITREGDNGNVVLASRPGYTAPYRNLDAYRFTASKDDRGLPVYMSRNITLADGRVKDALGVPKGGRAIAFDIYDNRMRDAEGEPTVVGQVLVHQDAAGKFVSFRNISIAKEYRDQGYYHGEGVVAGMLQHNGTTPMEVFNIQSANRGDKDDALPFWKKIGTTILNYSSTQDVDIEGNISLNRYKQAGEKRGNNGQSSRDSREQPIPRRDGARGEQSDAGGDRRAQGVSRRQSGTVRAVRAELVDAFGEAGIAALEREGILQITTWDNAPKGLTNQLESGDHGAYWPSRKTAFIFADNLAPGQAVEVLLHEIGEHYGLKEMLGDRYDKVVNQVKTLHKAGNRAIVDAWKHVERNYDHKPGSPVFMQEVIAKAGQSADVRKMAWWQRLIADVKAFLIKVGLKNVTSERDLGILLRASVRRAMRDAGAIGDQASSVMASRLSDQLKGMNKDAGGDLFKGAVELDGGKVSGMESNDLRDWLAGSKAVDSEGNPLLLYHGSSERDLRTIEPGYDEPGAWFTRDRGYAGQYARDADGYIYEVYLNIKNPLVVRFEERNGIAIPLIDGEPAEFDDNIAIVKYAMRNGFDGVHFPDGNFSEADEAWVAFRTDQIRIIEDENSNGRAPPSEGRGVSDDAPLASRNQTRTPAFKAWFGDSKVVDENGAPMVVYHSTTFGDFSTFDKTQQRKGMNKDAGGDLFKGAPELDKPLSDAQARKAWNAMLDKVGVKGLAGLVFNWNEGELSEDGSKIINFAGRDRAQTMAGQGGSYRNSKAEFVRWLMSDAPFDAAKIQQDAEWRAEVDAARQASGLMPDDAPLASRGTIGATWDMLQSAKTPAQARALAMNLFDNPNKFNLWDKTIGTQLNKARKNEYFRAVFDNLQGQQDSTAAYAIEAEAEAADVLARMEGMGEIKSALKSTLTGERAKDLREVSKAIFSNIEGEQGVKQKVYTDAELAKDFGLNERQIGLYRQSRAAIDRSLDRYAQSLAVRTAQKFVYTGDLHRAGLDDTVTALTERLRLQRQVLEEQREPEQSVEDMEARLAELEEMRDSAPREILRSLQMGPDGEMRQEYANLSDTAAAAALDREIRDLKKAIRSGDEFNPANRELDAKIQALDAVLSKLPEIQEQANSLKDKGYAPAMRFGDYAVTATQDGETVFFTMVDTKTQANLLKMRLAKELPGADLRVNPVDRESFKLFGGVDPATVELFARFMEVEENDAFKAYIALATSSRSALKHMLERKGVAGFSDNLPRVLAAFITSNSRAAARNIHGFSVNEAMETVQKKARGDVSEEAAKLVNYMNNPTGDFAKVRGFMFAYFMGGSVSSALVNLTQPVMMTAPYLSQFAGAKTAGIMARASKAAATGKVEGAMKAALDRAEAEGITDAHEYHQLMQEAEGGGTVATRALMKAWGSMFGAAERFNRRITFLAAYETAQGMTREDLNAQGVGDAYEFAKNAVVETQGIYARHNRPNWARNPVGALALTFKQFGVAYLEFFMRLPRKQQLMALGLLVLMAGIEGLPFAEDLEDLIDTIGQRMGYGTNSKRALHQAATGLGKAVFGTMGETAAQFALHGISGISGIPMDVAGRLGMGNLIPGTKLLNPSVKEKAREVAEIAGPAAGLVQKAGGLADGQIKEAMPKAFADAAKAWEMLQTGEYRDTKGRKVMEVDGLDTLMKLIGFQPAEIAAKSRFQDEQRRDINIVKTVEADIVEQWADGVREKDVAKSQEARERLKRWNEENPDLPIKVKFSQVLQRVRMANLTRDERFMKSAPPELRRRMLAETAQ